MRMKQLALATLFAAATAMPAFAQTAPATTTITPVKPAVTAPVAPVVPSTVPVKPVAAAPAATTPAATTPAAKPAKPEKIVKSTTAVVNINTGTSEELQTVKGIGKATATKIIAGRPYKAVDDLDTKKVIPHSSYTKLKAQFAI